MREYYDLRAQEYDRIYHRDDPLRQAEQEALADALRSAVEGRRVLEIACGTGYWTLIAAQTALQVVATDVSDSMLSVARAKDLPPDKVELRRADAFSLYRTPGEFDAGVANFWLSHVPRARVDEFLWGFHQRLGTGAVVFMADNIYMPGVGGELIREVDDTFKLRELEDGSKHRVLKNYYDGNQLCDLLSAHAEDLCVHSGNCFWWVTYTIR